MPSLSTGPWVADIGNFMIKMAPESPICIDTCHCSVKSKFQNSRKPRLFLKIQLPEFGNHRARGRNGTGLRMKEPELFHGLWNFMRKKSRDNVPSTMIATTTEPPLQCLQYISRSSCSVSPSFPSSKNLFRATRASSYFSQIFGFGVLAMLSSRGCMFSISGGAVFPFLNAMFSEPHREPYIQ